MAAAALWSSFAVVLAAATIADLRTRRIPDAALLAASAVAVVAIVLATPSAAPGRIAAAGAAGGILLALALARPGGLGLGDVKLGAVLGLHLGGGVGPALLIAFAAGGLWGVGMIVIRGWSARKATIPFAPFIALGACAAALGG
jgi:leader peptidase (prepilin peptidase)/N-methyltransferase